MKQPIGCWFWSISSNIYVTEKMKKTTGQCQQRIMTRNRFIIAKTTVSFLSRITNCKDCRITLFRLWSFRTWRIWESAVSCIGITTFVNVTDPKNGSVSQPSGSLLNWKGTRSSLDRCHFFSVPSFRASCPVISWTVETPTFITITPNMDTFGQFSNGQSFSCGRYFISNQLLFLKF